MKHLRKWLAALVACAGLLMLLPGVLAAGTEAEDLTSTTAISGTGYNSFAFLKDGNIKSYVKSAGDTVITLENEKGIGSLYIMFDLEYGAYTLVNNDTGATATAGQHGILHEFVDVNALFGAPAKSVTLKLEKGAVKLSEIFSFTVGETPDFVQKWNAPAEKADLVLFATHGDDDQLYFAGLLPKYSAQEDCTVQVVYLTDHRNLTFARTHEMINGLWAVGVRHYPVFGGFADFRIDSLEDSYKYYASLGTSKEDLQGFVVEQIRRFKPKVVVGHDPNGEYGHGMHRIYSDLVTKALDIVNDPEKYPESAQKYGTWEVQKTYLHLYWENKVVIDYDTPMEELGGLTPFEVTQKYGFPCHESQQWTGFTRWLNGAMDKVTIHKASEIATYSPCQFGLYRSTVGEDVAKNDFLENIETYAQQSAREEAERKALEEQQRQRLEEIMKNLAPFAELKMNQTEQQQFDSIKAELEAMKTGEWKAEYPNRMEVLGGKLVDLENTVKERIAQDRINADREEAQRREEAAKQQAQQVRQNLTIAVIVLVVLVAVLVIVIIVMRVQNIRRHKRRMKAKSREK